MTQPPVESALAPIRTSNTSQIESGMIEDFKVMLMVSDAIDGICIAVGEGAALAASKQADQQDG